MKYISINNAQDLENIIKKIDDVFFLTLSLDFLRDKHTHIYGYFINEKGIDEDILFLFGRTITPDEITPAPQNSIFSQLKQYGSSKKYKGLLNYKGAQVISNIYDDILLVTPNHFQVGKNGKCALMSHDRRLLTEQTYDSFFDAGEHTIGFIKNGRMGFMNKNGEIVLEANYEPDNETKFVNGEAMVYGVVGKTPYKYIIDHYGQIVSLVENLSKPIFEDYGEHHMGTGYYPYGDLPSASDAYEGDSDAYWNTD